MTIAQIMAVVSLLLAFGVDQPTVSKVEVILASHQSVTIQAMDTEPVFEAKPQEEGVEEQEAPKQSGYTTPPGGTVWTTPPTQQ